MMCAGGTAAAGSLLPKGDRGLDAVTWLSLPG